MQIKGCQNSSIFKKPEILIFIMEMPNLVTNWEKTPTQPNTGQQNKSMGGFYPWVQVCDLYLKLS